MDDKRIVALAFDSAELADEAMRSAQRMQDDELVCVHDALTVARSEDGSVGSVPASSLGAQAAKLAPELARPGQTLLALLVSNLAGMAVIEELRRFGRTRVVYARMPLEA